MNDRDRRYRSAGMGAALLSLVAVGAMVLMMRWEDDAWMAELKSNVLAYAGLALVFVALAVTSRRFFEKARDPADFSPTFPEARRLDTVVVAISVRGAAGRAFLDRVEGWRDMSPARQLEAVAFALQEHRSAWASGAWLDDEPVPAEDAASRVDVPLDRLEAALPDPKNQAAGYRGGPDTRAVIVAFGGTSPRIANTDEDGLDGLLGSLIRVDEWHHVRVVCGGPIEADQIDSLPFPFRAV